MASSKLIAGLSSHPSVESLSQRSLHLSSEINLKNRVNRRPSMEPSTLNVIEEARNSTMEERITDGLPPL